MIWIEHLEVAVIHLAAFQVLRRTSNRLAVKILLRDDSNRKPTKSSMASKKDDKITGAPSATRLTRRVGEGQSTVTVKATFTSSIAMAQMAFMIQEIQININEGKVRTGMKATVRKGTLKSSLGECNKTSAVWRKKRGSDIMNSSHKIGSTARTAGKTRTIHRLRTGIQNRE